MKDANRNDSKKTRSSEKTGTKKTVKLTEESWNLIKYILAVVNSYAVKHATNLYQMNEANRDYSEKARSSEKTGTKKSVKLTE